METRYYHGVSRYASGAFRRMQLERLLARDPEAPTIFDTEQEAAAFLQQTGS